MAHVIVIYAALLAMICIGAWRRFKRANPEGRLRYRITDIWALSIGMTPALVLAAFVLKHLQTFLADHNIVAFLAAPAVGAAQLAGMFISALDFNGASVDAKSSASHSGLDIIAGAIFGLGLALICGITALILGGIMSSSFSIGVQICVLFVGSVGVIVWLCYPKRK